MDISRHHSQGKYLESQPLQLLSSLPSESRRSSRPQQQGQKCSTFGLPVTLDTQVRGGGGGAGGLGGGGSGGEVQVEHALHLHELAQ